MALNSYSIANPFAIELSFALTLFVAMKFPPSFESWHYTGQHRIRSLRRQPIYTLKNAAETPPILDRLISGPKR
jgi:hypothetical protein